MVVVSILSLAYLACSSLAEACLGHVDIWSNRNSTEECGHGPERIDSLITSNQRKVCNRDTIPEKVEARQDTTAEEILRRCSKDMLKAMFTITKSKGSSGAPSHPARRNFIFRCLNHRTQRNYW